MKVKNFRELLVKKAEGDDTLQTLVKFVDSEVLAEKALESLEKMARSRHKGDTANLALRDFAQDMDPEMHPQMIRDALGHHVSRYKAALGANRQDLANKHAKQAFNIMNMADRAQKHSQGKLSFEHVSPHAWERNKMTSTYDADHPKVQEGKYRAGDFKTKTKGLNYRGSDFSHLQDAPHESFKREIRRHGHNKAYPFNQIKVNGKYIHIDDVDPSELSGYESHPFDKHPILDHYNEPAKKRTPESDKEYFDAKKDYYDSEHIDNFFDRQEKLESQDPEGYAKRGAEPSAPVHKDIEGLNIEDVKPETKAAPKETAEPKSKKLDLHPNVIDAIKQHNPDFMERIKGHLKTGGEE